MESQIIHHIIQFFVDQSVRIRSEGVPLVRLKIKASTGAALQLTQSIVAIVGSALAAAVHDHDRQLHDSDLIGEYNYRTGRLDAGNDAYGWYDED